MSAEDVEMERIYTINLRKVLITPRWRRTVRAVNLIKEFARKHMKTSEVKVDESINHLLWMRGIESPPRKLVVKMVKDKEGVVTVSLPTED
ncbi:MAG: 50S ribosomal protein L31e [Nitrososphaerales archaeon]